MMENIRSFAFVAIDTFDNVLESFPIDYADTPKNLGFELEFTTLESRLTTYFTSVREKKLPTSLNINFLPPGAYGKANAFKQFVQRHINDRMLFEYNDTTETKYWEGKVQKFEQEELTEWGGLVCPVSFLPATPKFLKKDNVIQIQVSTTGKSYPFKYPYTYGRTILKNSRLENNYFHEVPLRVYLYGKLINPQVDLYEVGLNGELMRGYTSVRFKNLTIEEGEHLIIDAVQAKVLLWRDGRYTSAYDYVDKSAHRDTFLFAKGATSSELVISISPEETGYLKASYRQYTL